MEQRLFYFRFKWTSIITGLSSSLIVLENSNKRGLIVRPDF